MEDKVKGKFVTTSKVKNFQNPSCHILEKIHENYDKKYFGYHEAFKIYTAPKLLMYTKVIEHSYNDVIHYDLNIPSKGHNEQSQ